MPPLIRCADGEESRHDFLSGPDCALSLDGASIASSERVVSPESSITFAIGITESSAAVALTKRRVARSRSAVATLSLGSHWVLSIGITLRHRT